MYNDTTQRYKPQYFLALGSKLSNILNIWPKEDITGIRYERAEQVSIKSNGTLIRMKKSVQKTSHHIENEIIIVYLV